MLDAKMNPLGVNRQPYSNSGSDTWEHAADTVLLKLQRLQSQVLRAVGNFDRCTLVSELQATFKIPYVYGYIIKLCRSQSEVNLNHVNPNIHGTGQEEAMYRKYKRLILGGGQTYDRSTNCSFRVVK
jgi:hypothetical protein